MPPLESIKILFVDDEPDILKDYKSNLFPETNLEVRDILERRGKISPNHLTIQQSNNLLSSLSANSLLLAESGESAVEMVKKEISKGHHIAVGFFDIKMPGGMDGFATIKAIRELQPEMFGVVVTAYTDWPLEQLATAFGEPDKWIFTYKPIQKAELTQLTEHLLAMWLKRRKKRVGRFIGQSEALLELCETIERVAETDITVLITGETGVGKELTARTIHEKSKRCAMPFKPVHIATIPEGLLASTLFGHTKGAFTGADADKKGLLELAQGGTIFFDEIGAINLSAQTLLLRVLEEKIIRPLGSSKEIPIDVRWIFATNLNLEEEVKKGNFKEDLLYRINEFIIRVPTLEERKDDIPLLAKHFLKEYCKENNRSIKGFESSVMELLMKHKWSGNIRELKSLVKRSAVFCDDDIIHTKHLRKAGISDVSLGESEIDIEALERRIEQGEEVSLDEAVDNFEKRVILKALNKNNQNISSTAKQLGLKYHSILQSKMKKLNITKGV